MTQNDDESIHRLIAAALIYTSSRFLYINIYHVCESSRFLSLRRFSFLSGRLFLVSIEYRISAVSVQKYLITSFRTDDISDFWLSTRPFSLHLSELETVLRESLTSDQLVVPGE